MALFQPVRPAPAERPTTGLVASALTPTDGERWQTGTAWRPERCPTATGFNPECGLETPFAAPTGGGDDDAVYYLPQAFRVDRTCINRGGTMDEDLATVTRQAEAVTSFMVARELQDGALTRSAPFDSPAGANQTNPFLASSDAVVIAGTYTPEVGLGLLEQTARQDALGQDVWIHMPVAWVPLFANRAIERDGPFLRTLTGARVVADAGYTGDGVLSAGTAEVQTVTITGVPTGGTFTLTYSGQTTAPIAYNATAAAVQTALLALSNVETGDLVVTGGPGPGTPYVVTFDAYLGNVAQMTASGAGLTGGTAPAVGVATTTPGSAPAAAAGDFLYATGPVQVRLGEIQTYPIDDWRNNRRTAVAERLFAATFSPCTQFAVAIELPVP